MTGPERSRRGRSPRASDERGAATAFVAVAAVGLLVLIGLIVDGGAKVRAIERADTLAAEAARAGGQVVALPAVMSGRALTVDPAQARTAALDYLAGQGATGTVSVAPGGRTLTVTVVVHQPTVLLGLIGIPEITGHGTASATLLRGITGVIP